MARRRGQKEDDATNAAQEIKSFAKSLLAVRGVPFLPPRPAALPGWASVALPEAAAADGLLSCRRTLLKPGASGAASPSWYPALARAPPSPCRASAASSREPR